MGLLTLPTHLAQFIPFLKGKFPPPFALYIFSLMTNFGLSFLIGLVEADIDNFTQFSLYIMLGILLYVNGVMLSYLNCCCNNQDWERPSRIDEEISAGILSQEEFNNQLAQNRAMPPIIQVIARAYHYVPYTTQYRDANGNLITETRYIPFYKYYNDAILLYKSWQEDGNPITLEENTSLIHDKIDYKFIFDDKSLEIINCMRTALYNDAKQHDLYCSVTNNFYIPSMSEVVCGSTRPFGGKMPCSSKWIPTCGGKFLIGFLKLLGYHTIIYSLWVSMGQNMKMKLIKNISMMPKEQSGLRCNYNTPDFQAIDNTFRSDNPKLDVEQPQYDQNKINETLTTSNKPYFNTINNLDPEGKINLNPGRQESIEQNSQLPSDFQMNSINQNETIINPNDNSQFAIMQNSDYLKMSNSNNINAIRDYNNKITDQENPNNINNEIPIKNIENDNNSDASLSNSDESKQ